MYSISGDCSSTISISPMSMSKLYQHETSDLKSFDELCKDKPIYEIVKTKDFNRCKTTPVSYYAQPATYMCSLDKANCADSLMVCCIILFFVLMNFATKMFLFVLSYVSAPCPLPLHWLRLFAQADLPVP